MSKRWKLLLPTLLLLLMVAQASACPPFDFPDHDRGGNNHGGRRTWSTNPATGEIHNSATITLDRFDLDPGNTWIESVLCLYRPATKQGGWYQVKSHVYVKGSLRAYSKARAIATASVSAVLWVNGEQVAIQPVDRIDAKNDDNSKPVEKQLVIRGRVYLPKGAPVVFCSGIRSYASVDGGGGKAEALFGSGSNALALVSRLSLNPSQ